MNPITIFTTIVLSSVISAHQRRVSCVLGCVPEGSGFQVSTAGSLVVTLSSLNTSNNNVCDVVTFSEGVLSRMHCR